MMKKMIELTPNEASHCEPKKDAAGHSKNPSLSLTVLPGKIFKSIRNRIPQFNRTIFSDAFQYWSKSSDNPAVGDMSHWRGEGRFANTTKWDSIGQGHAEMVENLSQMANLDKQVTSVVEWGPGGGGNAVKFCETVDRFYGVDISATNLAECRRQLDIIGFKGFRDILIDIESPHESLSKIEKPVDLFLSTAVYQHFPSKAYGIQVTKIAWQMLSVDGIALIQIRYDDGSPGYRKKIRDYKKNFRVFTSYPIPEFWQISQDIGFKPLYVSLEPSVNYAYFFLKKKPLAQQ